MAIGACPRVPAWLNLLLFQTVWLVTVLGAVRGYGWPGYSAFTLFAGITLLTSRRPAADIALVGASLALGACVETWNHQTGILVFPTQPAGAPFVPGWILILWCALGLTLNHGLAWLQPRPWLAAVLGAAGGTASYCAGVALGAATFGISASVAALIFGVTWAGVAPLLMLVARQIGRTWK